MPKQIHRIEGTVAPMGPYSPVVEANGFIFFSGQVAIDASTNERVDGDVSAQAAKVMENLETLLGGVGLGFDDIVKATIFLTDMNDYAAVNEVYGARFGDSPPARSAVAVAALPGGFNVEIEAIVAR
ncbi:MAG: Rid family detoxifying hydrolase [Acidimicrobiia bacterium]|nr:Rid family detoxifying hydrolase [Acidimicrobiia bacterium]